MLSKVASLFALIPMLLHSILGCCWHHEHAHGNAAVASVISTVEETAEHDGHHAACAHHGDSGANESGDQDGHRCPHSPCEEGRCVVAETAVSVTPETIVLNWDRSVGIVAIAVPCVEVSQSSSREESTDGRTLPSSSQRRALRQVWLV